MQRVVCYFQGFCSEQVRYISFCRTGAVWWILCTLLRKIDSTGNFKSSQRWMDSSGCFQSRPERMESSVIKLSNGASSETAVGSPGFSSSPSHLRRKIEKRCGKGSLLLYYISKGNITVTFLGVEQRERKGHKIVQKNCYNAGHQVFDAHNFAGEDPYLMAWWWYPCIGGISNFSLFVTDCLKVNILD